jgi:hypothetical protein
VLTEAFVGKRVSMLAHRRPSSQLRPFVSRYHVFNG